MVVRPLTVARLVFVLIGLFSFKTLAQYQLAKVTGEYPYVYSSSDFNAPVIAELPRGKLLNVSTKKFANVFYFVSVKPGMSGYVSDSEIQLISKEKKQLQRRNLKEKPAEKKASKEKPRKPFYTSRYRGIIVEQMNYAEDTMSQHRTANLTMIGYRVVGMNTLFSGEMSTDASILLYFGAPKYYEEITKEKASGWILHTDFTFDTIYPQSKIHFISYGFGPMFRYSHFVTSLRNTTNSYTTDYPMDDMTLGVLLRLGLAFRINNISIRSDVKYYIEAQRYFAYNLSALFEF